MAQANGLSEAFLSFFIRHSAARSNSTTALRSAGRTKATIFRCRCLPRQTAHCNNMPNKTFLIAGGSSGIGLALVKKISARGDRAIVLSRTAETLSNLPGVEHHSVDLRSGALPADLLPDALHGLAYCPGSINLRPFRSLKPEAFLEDFQINVVGAIHVLQAAQTALKNAGSAGVVLFSTVAVHQGMPFHASVAAAKGAVEGLTRSLAAEWAPEIRVNCLAPSLTDTPLAGRLLASPEKREAAASRHPLRRTGTPDDIAGLALFLLDPESSWISGQVIGIDGGLSRLRV